MLGSSYRDLETECVRDLADSSKARVARTGKCFVQPHASQASLRCQLRDVSCPRDVTERRKEEGRIVFIRAGSQVGGNVLFSLEVVGCVVPSEGFFGLGHVHVSQQAAISVASRMSLT
nr:putative integron gene cassette protein [uncultured bacterium]